MCGCYDMKDPEDRARAHELDRYLDAQASGTDQDQKYLDALYDEAESACCDDGYMEDLMECEPDAIATAIALLMREADEPLIGVDMYRQRSSAFVAFRDRINELMQTMPAIKQNAKDALSD